MLITPVWAKIKWHDCKGDESLSKKQNSIFLSTFEAKYIVARRCCTQLLLMKKKLKDYGIEEGTMNIHYDNFSGINISKNSVLHSHNKHIEIRHHFINDLVEEKVVSLEFVPTKHQLVNILTKPLDSLRFEFLRKSLSICLINRSSKVIGFKGFELIVYVLFASFGILLVYCGHMIFDFLLDILAWFVISRVCELEKYTRSRRLDVGWFIDIC